MHWSCMIYVTAATIVGFIWGVVLTMVCALACRPSKKGEHELFNKS